jgi:hypothetical protein
MLEIYYELSRWVGEDNDQVLRLDKHEDWLTRMLVRVMRSGGWMPEFLWGVICDEAAACRSKEHPRLSPERVRAILAEKTREAEAA